MLKAFDDIIFHRVTQELLDCTSKEPYLYLLFSIHGMIVMLEVIKTTPPLLQVVLKCCSDSIQYQSQTTERRSLVCIFIFGLPYLPYGLWHRIYIPDFFTTHCLHLSLIWHSLCRWQWECRGNTSHFYRLNPISLAVATNTQLSEILRCDGHHPAGSSYSRKTQCYCRWSHEATESSLLPDVFHGKAASWQPPLIRFSAIIGLPPWSSRLRSGMCLILLGS